MNPGSVTITCHFCTSTTKCSNESITKGLSTREAGRGHATPQMPVEMAKCWWLLKIEPSLSLKPAQTPSKMGQNLLAKLYDSPTNSRAPTASRSTQTAQLPHTHLILFLVTTSILPSLQAYAELHALSPLRGSISPWFYVKHYAYRHNVLSKTKVHGGS